MEQFGLGRSSSAAGTIENFISRHASSVDMGGGLHRRELRTGSTFAVSAEGYGDRDPFSMWDTCEEAQVEDSQLFLEDPLNFKCVSMNQDEKCFVGTVQQLRRFKMEKHLEDMDHELIIRAKDAILKRNHAFQKVWEVNKDFGESIDAQLGTKVGKINWKNWPPAVPPATSGVKIPVEFYPDVEYDLRNPCALKRVDMGLSARPQEFITTETFQNLKGILNTYKSTSFRVTPETLIFPFSKLGQRYTSFLKVQNVSRVPRRIGIVSPKSRFFDIIWGAELNSEAVIPPGLAVRIIVNFKPLADVAVNDLLTILVSDDGILLVPLLTSSESPPILEMDEFDCGCSTLNRVRVNTFSIRNISGSGRFWLLSEEEFTSENHNITSADNEFEQHRISMASNDGEVEVAILLAKVEKKPRKPKNAQPPYPVNVEIEGEFHQDNGVGNAEQAVEPSNARKLSKPPYAVNHEIEGEFAQDNGKGDAVLQAVEPSNPRKISKSVEDGRKHSYEAENEPEMKIKQKNSLKPEHRPQEQKKKSKSKKSKKGKRDTLIIKPFKLFPCCFSLERNEIIEIKAKFKPTEASFHYEKLVLVCDNGEVRWIALKGIGVDQMQQELVSIQGEWTGPPCDLPADLNTNLCIDCGDQLYGESTQRKFVLVNNSCIPMYFFWSIRKLAMNAVVAYPGEVFQHYVEGCVTADSTADSEDFPIKNDTESPIASILIYPSQGVLACREQLNCILTAFAPEVLGYHGCIISLFVQQVDENSQHLLQGLITDLERLNLNAAPIYHDKVFSSNSQSELPSNVAQDIHPFSPPEDLPIPTKHAPRPKLSLTESKFLVPTPRFLNLDQTEGTKDNFSNVEFYLAILKLHMRHKSIAEGDPRSTKQFEFLDITKKLHHHNKLSEPTIVNPEDVSIPIHVAGIALEPVKELEVWLRTVPMQCCFDPPFIVATGTAASTLERRFVFHNQTLHPINISFAGTINKICSILITPSEFTAAPDHLYEFRATIHFEKSGEISDDLIGVLTLPFTSMECTLPFNIECTGPLVEVLTPLIDFGLVCYGQERVRTLAIKNTGLQKCTWRANISKVGLQDEQNHVIAMDESSLENNKLVRFWPEWGTLEPKELTGIQVYLTPSIHGKITTSIEINVEGNPNNALCVPVWAEVQSPTLFLRNPNLILRDIFVRVPVQCASVILVNPTIFLVNFKWGEAIGAQKEFCQVSVKPMYGTVLPRRLLQIQLTITVDRELLINNLFVPCCVDGMKEPLVLQIEGEVRGPQITIILPETRPSPINTCMEDLEAAGEGGYYRRSTGYSVEDKLTGEEDQDPTVWLAHNKKKKGSRKRKATAKGSDETVTSIKMEKGRKKRNKWALPLNVVEAVVSMKADAGKSKRRKSGISYATKASKPRKSGFNAKRKEKLLAAKSEATLASAAKSKDKLAASKSKVKMAVLEPDSAEQSTTANEEPVETKKTKKGKKSKSTGSSSSAAALLVKSKKDKKKKSASLSDSIGGASGGSNKKSKKKRKQSRLASKPEKGEATEESAGDEHVQDHFAGEYYENEEGCEDAGEGEYSNSCSTPGVGVVPSPFYTLTPHNTPEVLNKIYFEELEGRRVNKRTFVVKNASPMKAAFAFTVIRYPLQSWIDETKSPVENLIMRRMMSSSPQDVESRIFGQNNVAFEVCPKNGLMDPYSTMEVDIILHTMSCKGTGRSIIYRDEIHCQIDGLTEPYMFSLEASVNSGHGTSSVLPNPLFE